MPHSIDIYRDGSLFVTIKPDDSSVQNKTVMGDNFIQLDFTLSYYAGFKINDSCTVFGETYKIVDDPTVTKQNKFSYKYSIKMRSEGSDLEKVQFLGLDGSNNLREPEFSLMGNAQTFVDLLLQNAGRVLTGWTAGEIIQTDYKNLTFSSDNLLSALAKIADAFSTEWWVVGKTIMLTKKVKDTGITLKHGRAKGLYEIQRQQASDSKIITQVWPYGGKTNIPFDYGSERLRIRIRGTVIVNGVVIGEILDDNFTNNASVYGIIEQTALFDDIYPKRTGKVTGVDATDIYTFTDSTMDFDLNSNLLPGLPAKVVFNTGNLAGYQFEISKYDPATKKITILKNKDETTLDIPSTLLKPEIGDEYVFVDIKLPDDYVVDAEMKLYLATLDYLKKVSNPQYSFSITLDPAHVSRNNLSFSIGDLIWITDNDLSIDRKIRVTQTSRKIVEESQYTLTLSDTVSQGTIPTINNNISTAQSGVDQLSDQLQNNALLNGIMIVPPVSDVAGMFPLYVNANGKVFRKE